MCDCLKEFIESLKKEHGDSFLINAVIFFRYNGAMKILGFSAAADYLKEFGPELIPRFCPWCGKKYE